MCLYGAEHYVIVLYVGYVINYYYVILQQEVRQDGQEGEEETQEEDQGRK